MVTDSNHYKGRLLSTHSMEVLKLRTLAQRLKDAQDAQTYGPLAIPTGTSEPSPSAPPNLMAPFGHGTGQAEGERGLVGPEGKRTVAPPTAMERLLNRLSPEGSPSRFVGKMLTTPQTAEDLQNAPPWQSIMMGMPVGAPAGSIAGTAGKGVLTQAGATLGRAIETGGVSAGIPKAAETVAARVPPMRRLTWDELRNVPHVTNEKGQDMTWGKLKDAQLSQRQFRSQAGGKATEIVRITDSERPTWVLVRPSPKPPRLGAPAALDTSQARAPRRVGSGAELPLEAPSSVGRQAKMPITKPAASEAISHAAAKYKAKVSGLKERLAKAQTPQAKRNLTAQINSTQKAFVEMRRSELSALSPAAKAAQATEGVPKEPWQLTKSEADALGFYEAGRMHMANILTAIHEGKAIPNEVIESYGPFREGVHDARVHLEGALFEQATGKRFPVRDELREFVQAQGRSLEGVASVAPVEAKAALDTGGHTVKIPRTPSTGIPIVQEPMPPSTGATAAAGEAGIPSSAVPPKAIQGNLPPMKQGPRQPNFNAGPRAPVEPGPHTIMPPTKPPPPGELPPAPPSGEFPSGRKAPTLEEAAARATEPLPPVDNYQRLVESSRNPPSEPFVAKMREGAYKFLKGFTDRNQLLTKMSTSEGVSVHDLAQVVPGATLEGENVLRLKAEPIYQALGQKNIPYLQDYMVAMRDSDILARNPHAVLPGNVQGYQGVQESIAAIKAKVGDAELARIQLAAQARWNVQKAEVLDYAVSRGLLSETDAAAMTSAHPHYIPFMRTDWVEALDAAYAAGTKPEASLSSLGLQQMDLAGSTRNLENPLARMDAQIIKIRRMNARNEAAKGIADSLEEMQKTSGVPLIHYLEPAHLRTDVNLAGGVKQSVGHLQTPEGTVPGTISFIKNGEHYIAEVPEEYAAVAKGMGEEPPDGVTRLAGLMNAPLKLGATGLNTAFIPVNAVRDAQSAYFNAGLSPFSKYYWQGVQASWFKNDLFNEAVNVRAMGGGFVESMRPASAISRAQSQFYGALRVHTVQDALLAIPRSIERLNVNVERGTRIGVYAKAKAEGLSDLEAAVKARNATADFSKAGTTMKIVNQWIPFSNAAVQGTAASVMRVKGHPWQAAAAAAPFLAMTALSRANNMRFDSYNSIPDYVFNNNWVLQYGEVTHKDGTVYPVYVTVPKGQFISAVVFPLEAMFNQARKTNDKTVAQNLMQAGLGAAQNISPVSDVSSVVPAPLQAYIEVKANKDFYTGQPIVSQSQQNLPTEQQFGPGTSKTAIALGHAFNISPLLIEHAIQATTGGAGQQVAWLAGLGLQVLGYNLVPYGSELSKNTKETSVPEQLGTIPGIKRFVGTKNTKETLAGWDDFNAAVADTNSQFAKIPTMNGLGIRLGSVGDSLAPPPRLKGDSRQLTPKERAQYQTLMAQQVIAGLTAFVDKMDMTQPPDDRRTLIAKEMGTLKKAAAASFNDVLLSAKPTLKERLSQRTATPTPKMMTLRERLALSATPMPEPVGATP